MSTYSHVFLLSADITGDGQSFELADTDTGGVLLGSWRLRAAKRMLEEQKAQKIVVVGYHDEQFTDMSRAEVLRTMLVNEHGVDASLVEAVTQEAPGTKGNVEQICAYISAHHLNASECAVLSNFYHLPRAMALFAQYGVTIAPVAAEALFPEEIEEIVHEYSTHAFSERLASELRGLAAL
ncbi:MAG: ElyC/SanA/YdcF family protein [Bacillota bacterium]